MGDSRKVSLIATIENGWVLMLILPPSLFSRLFSSGCRETISMNGPAIWFILSGNRSEINFKSIISTVLFLFLSVLQLCRHGELQSQSLRLCSMRDSDNVLEIDADRLKFAAGLLEIRQTVPSCCTVLPNTKGRCAHLHQVVRHLPYRFILILMVSVSVLKPFLLYHFLVNSVETSMLRVKGNMSTGTAFFISYPPSVRTFRFSPRVSGLQEM